MTTKIYAPDGWGRIKSNTHYAWIDDVVHPLRPNKLFVKYKGRWRHIQIAGDGATFLEYPGATVFFEIKEFDKR